jgi:hypothetical protein
MVDLFDPSKIRISILNQYFQFELDRWYLNEEFATAIAVSHG